jgi:hypothetical protein
MQDNLEELLNLLKGHQETQNQEIKELLKILKNF